MTERRRPRARNLEIATLVFCTTFVLPRSASAAPEPIFVVTVSIAPGDDGKDVRDRDWVYAQLDLAEHLYAPLGVHVHVAQFRTLDARLARIGDPKERDAFAPLVTPGTIDVFVVRSLRDADVKTLYRMGVTWDSHTTPSRRYIVLSAEAKRSSLAHELGHYLGIQPHSAVKNNLMSYDREDDQVFLDAAQAALVTNAARVFRTSGSLQVFGLTP